MSGQVANDPPSKERTGEEDVQIVSEKGIIGSSWPEFPKSDITSASRQSKISECKGIGPDNQARSRKLEEELARLKDSDSSSASKVKRTGDGSEIVASKRRRISGTLALQFPWANWQGEVAYCNPCSLARGEMKVVNKSDNKVDLFRQHEKSKSHIKNEKIYKDETFAPPTQRHVIDYSETPSEKIQRLKAYQFTLVLSQLRNYGSINGLKCFVDDMNAILVTDTDRHLMKYASTSTYSYWQMVEAIDHVLKREVKRLIKEADHIAFTIDSSTDNSTTDYMDVELRLWKDGKVLYLFLEMVKMGEEMKALNQATLVLNVIKDYIGGCEKSLSCKVISVGADGCSTMQGLRNGVLKHLRDAFPFMLPTSCAAHKANLACEVIDKVPAFKYLCNLVKDVRNYFSNSPKRTSKLKSACAEVDLKFKRIEKIIDVRWMPVSHAFHSFCKVLPGILHYLEGQQHDEAEAKRLFMELTDFTTLWEIFLYLPLLDRLTAMMKNLQKQNLFFDDLETIIGETHERIQKDYVGVKAFQGLFQITFSNLFETHGPLFEVYQSVNPFTKHQDSNGNNTVYFKRHTRAYTLHFNRMVKEEQKILELDNAKVRANSMLDLLNDDPEDLSTAKLPPLEWMLPSNHERFANAIKSTADIVSDTAKAFLNALQERLPPNEILKAFGIVSPKFFLQKDAEDLLIQYTNVLAKQFGCVTCPVGQRCSCSPPIQNCLLKREMEHFLTIGKNKSTEYMDREDINGEGPIHFLNFLLDRGMMQSTCPEYSKLMKLIVTVPLTTVENERRFAHMNLTKTDLRASLAGQHLNACLRIKHVPQEVWKIDEFYTNLCIPAYQEWSQSCERRP